jgi:hypothetical protein
MVTTIIVSSIAVAMVAFILYAIERKSRGEPIVWEHAGKISVFSGLVTSGVVFATSGEGMPDLTKTVVEAVAPVQEMFVGTPTF